MVMRNSLRPFALVLPLTLLAAASTLSAAQELERIVSAESTPAGIAVTVATGGCTKKTDFDVSSSPAVDGKATVEFKRTKPDICKGNFPDGLKLQYSWAELKLPEGTQLSVKNPVAPVVAVQANPPSISHELTVMRHRHSHYRRSHRHHHYRHFHKHRGHYCCCPCPCDGD